MGYGLLCGLWVGRRGTNRRPCCPPMSNPTTSLWTVRPDCFGRWDNRMAAQHLSRDPYSAAKQRFEELAQKKKNIRAAGETTATLNSCHSTSASNVHLQELSEQGRYDVYKGLSYIFVCQGFTRCSVGPPGPVCLCRPGVPNLLLIMYPFSILTDEHVPLKFLLWQNILSWLVIDILNNKHKKIFENYIYWYMHKYLEINNTWMYFSFYC